MQRYCLQTLFFYIQNNSWYVIISNQITIFDCEHFFTWFCFFKCIFILIFMRWMLFIKIEYYVIVFDDAVLVQAISVGQVVKYHETKVNSEFNE